MNQKLLRKVWENLITFDWRYGITLILLFGIARFIIVLNGIATGSNAYVSIIFLVMIITPIVFLNREGRKQSGFRRPTQYLWILYSFSLGLLAAFLFHLLGIGLFQKSLSNWFVYIGSTYPLDFAAISPDEKQVYFFIYAIIGMTFSPLGEEFLDRGVIHRSLAIDIGDKNAALIDSAAFGLTHLAHFGLIYTAGQWRLLTVPALLWVMLIFLTGLLFNLCRNRSGSIWGAVIAHAGFNLGMTYLIFYHLF